MVTLDASAAWHSARRMVFANRDMLVAIAGVFFVLPGLIEAVLLPFPQLADDLTQQQVAEALVATYKVQWPVLVVLSLPTLLGYLTVLALLLDRDRPNVGTAIGLGLRLLPSYIAVQLLTGLGLGVLGMVALGALTTVVPPVVAGFVTLVVMVYPLVRVVLIGPEMVAGRIRNPISAIAGGLARTRGHFTGILLYFGPALALFAVIYGVAMIVTRIMLTGLPDSEAQRLITEAVAALLSAIANTFFAAMVVSTYDQLGPLGSAGTSISPSTPN